jgi:hypothetical protein
MSYLVAGGEGKETQNQNQRHNGVEGFDGHVVAQLLTGRPVWPLRRRYTTAAQIISSQVTTPTTSNTTQEYTHKSITRSTWLVRPTLGGQPPEHRLLCASRQNDRKNCENRGAFQAALEVVAHNVPFDLLSSNIWA